MKRFSVLTQSTLITGMRDLSYHERLQALRLYSLQRRRERYCIILIWKIIQSKAQNLSDPTLCNFSDRRGRSCVISHVNTGSGLCSEGLTWSIVLLRCDDHTGIFTCDGCARDHTFMCPARHRKTVEDREHSHTIASDGELFAY